MKSKKTAKQIQDEIDKGKIEVSGKEYSHHLIRITGTRNPMEYVVCTDGTEIAYTKFEDEILLAARLEEINKIKIDKRI